MAGKNNKKGRGTGGTISSQPAKPSMLKVSMFEQASREARSRIGFRKLKVGNQEDAAARGVNQRMKPRSEQMIPARGMRKTVKSLQTAQNARMYLDGIGGSRRTPGPAGLRAPSTRLY